MGSPGVMPTGFGLYNLIRGVGTPSISKFGGIPRRQDAVR